jgi:hypothetical protein
MRVVRDAAEARALSGRSRHRLLPVVALAATLCLPGCGGSGRAQSGATAARPASVPPASFALMQSADCNLWHVLDARERESILVGFKAFFGGRVDAASRAGQRGSALPDAKAATVLDRYCRLPFAGAFKLYKIYGRSAAFSS